MKLDTYTFSVMSLNVCMHELTDVASFVRKLGYTEEYEQLRSVTNDIGNIIHTLTDKKGESK